MKRLEITEKLKERIHKSVGSAIDCSGVAVFEAQALSTEPLTKRGSIFDKAVVTDLTLAEMAAYLQTEGSFVPLHTMHDNSGLPEGRVFYGEAKDSKLFVQFYLDAKDPMVEKIEKGIIEQVSVGVRSKQMLCSVCGWDYNGPESTFINFMDRTCAKDHTIGEDDCHIIMNGLDRFFEMSLVGIGAAKNAKILDRSRQVLSAADRERLAASGVSCPEASILFAQTVVEKEKTMITPEETAALTASISAQVLKDFEAKEAALKATAEADKASALQAAATAAAAEKETALKAASTDLAAAKAENAKMLSYLTEQTQKALVASGKDASTMPTDFDGLVKTLEEARLTLHNTFPAEGVAQGTAANSDKGAEVDSVARLSAFKTR